MSRALIPGSFDPITNGHLDVIKRAAAMFDEVIVLISKNADKNYMLCSKNRALLAEDAVKDIQNVTVICFDGLLVDFAKQNNIDVTIKGVRNSLDYEYEMDMASKNMLLSMNTYSVPFETLLLPCSKHYSDISSTVVRLLLQRDGDVSELVPNHKLLLQTIKG